LGVCFCKGWSQKSGEGERRGGEGIEETDEGPRGSAFANTEAQREEKGERGEGGKEERGEGIERHPRTHPLKDAKPSVVQARAWAQSLEHLRVQRGEMVTSSKQQREGERGSAPFPRREGERGEGRGGKRERENEQRHGPKPSKVQNWGAK
jgi:hypothetical protein